MPFSLVSAFFRIGSFIVFVTYISAFGFLPVGAFWFINVILSQNARNTTAGKEHQISVWLMSFMGVFVPAYFCPEYRKKEKGKKKKLISPAQLTFYRNQSIASLICYLPALTFIFVIVNYPSIMEKFNYNADVILDNFRFNLCIGIIAVEGLVSFVFSFSPRCSSILQWWIVDRVFTKPKPRKTQKEAQKKDSEKTCSGTKSTPAIKENSHGKGEDGSLETPSVFTIDENNSKTSNPDTIKEPIKKKKTNLKKKSVAKVKRSYTEQATTLFGCLIILGIVMAPIVVVFMKTVFSQAMDLRSYIFFPGETKNETIIIEAMYLPPENETTIDKNVTVEGVAKFIDPQFHGLTRRSLFNRILVMHRNTWEQKGKQKIDESINLVAIILIDTERFAPSSPPKPVSRFGPTSLKMYMARKNDSAIVAKDLDDNMISIVHQWERIPESKWICDTDEMRGGTCIEEKKVKDRTYIRQESGEPFPNRNTTWIKGKEYMTRTCYWGGKKCVGNHNSNMQQHDYCRGPETIVCPLIDNQWPHVYEQEHGLLDSSGSPRRIKWTPRTANECHVNAKANIESCDDNGSDRGKISGWSSLLGFNLAKFAQDIAEIQGRRYCSVYNHATGLANCILEEKVRVKCCEKGESCQNSLSQKLSKCNNLLNAFGNT